jgi:DNA transposition AAA+ family ATPase
MLIDAIEGKAKYRLHSILPKGTGSVANLTNGKQHRIMFYEDDSPLLHAMPCLKSKHDPSSYKQPI